MTLGHELSGIVEEVGEGVSRYKPGDRVVLEPIIFDGTCGACKDGHFNCCSSNGFVGVSGYGGGLSEHMVLDEKYLYPLPDDIPLQVGGKSSSKPPSLHCLPIIALIEPLSVAFRAVECANVKPTDRILVIGGGPIGLAIIACLNSQGIPRENIIVSEMALKRIELAVSLGAGHVLDPTKVDVVAECIEHFDGQGAHVAFDCAGVQAGLDAAIKATRAKATIVNVAVWEKPPTFPVNQLLFKEKVYRGTAAPEHKDFLNVLKALNEGKMQKYLPLLLVTKKIGLHEVEKEGFITLIEDRANHAKVLVKVGGGD